jgi:drug/metabolite transporter (DMT)-like permease
MKSALIKLHIAIFLWGFTGVLGRLITLNEGWLVWYRLLFTIAALGCWFLYNRKLEIFPKKTLLQLFAIGSIVALHWVFFYGSIKYGNVSIALICLSSSGMFTALLEPIIIKKKLAIPEVVLSGVAIAGICLIFQFNPQFKLGIVLGIICALLNVLFSIYNKKIATQLPSIPVVFYELLGGFIVLSCIMPFYNAHFPSTHILPTITDGFWLLILSIVCTIIAMSLSLQALKKLSAFTQNLLVNLEPVYGIGLAFILFNENKDLSPTFYWGFAIIFISVVIQMLRIVRLKKN